MRWSRCKVMSLALCTGLLTAGCSGGQDGKSTEMITVTVYDEGSDYTGLQKGWYARILEEKCGVRLEFLDKTAEDALKSADLLVCDGSRTDPAGLVRQGSVMDVSSFLEGMDVLEYDSQIRKWNEELGEDVIYVLPSRVSRMPDTAPSEERLPRYGFYVDWERYEAVGAPRIRDNRELLDVLEEMMETSEGEVTGLSLSRDGLLDAAARLAGVCGYERRGFVLIRPGDHDSIALLEEDSPFLDAVQWLREAWGRGLIDPESAWQTAEQAAEKYCRGEALLSLDPSVKELASGYELAPVEDMKVISYGCDPEGSMETFLAVGSGAEAPDRVAELIDWLFSTEGIMVGGTGTSIHAAGPQDLTWTMEDGNPVLTDFGQRALTEDPGAEVPDDWGGGSWQEGESHLSFEPVVSVEVSPSGFTYNYTLWNTVDSGCSAEWQERMDAADGVEYLTEKGDLAVLPAYASQCEEEMEESAGKRTECEDLIEDYLWRMIRTDEDRVYEKLLKELREEAEEAGYEEMAETDACGETENDR